MAPDRPVMTLLFRVLDRLARDRARLLSRLHAMRFAAIGPGALIRSPRSLIGCRYVSVGTGFDVYPGLRLEVFDRHLDTVYTPTMTIGDRVSINNDGHIACVNRVEIGDDVLMAARVYISDHAHGSPDYADIATPPSRRKVHSKGPVVIEPEVWIGEGACIMPGVRVGRGSIVGANAVVTRDVAPYSIVAGVPARLVRQVAPPMRANGGGPSRHTP